MATEITSNPTDNAQNPRNELHAWQTDEGEALMELRGSRVLIVEGIPRDTDSRALLKALWQPVGNPQAVRKSS